MIEIIEIHKPEEFEHKYRFTCSRCHSVADITRDEIKYGGVQWDSYYRFECPVCGKTYTANSSYEVLHMHEFKYLGD